MKKTIKSLKAHIVSNDNIYTFLKFSQFPLMKLVRHTIREKNQLNKFTETGCTKDIILTIESTSKCNTNCIFCPHKDMKRPKIDMSDEIFQRCINQCQQYNIQMVGLNFMGEPLTDRKLFDRIKRLKSLNLKVILSTNAMLLNQDNAQKLIESGVDEVIISLDACSEKTYKHIRSNGNFDQTVRNIERFINIRKESGSKTPYIKIGMMYMDESKSEIKAFLKQWGGKVEDATVRRMHSWAHDIPQKDFIKNVMPCRALWGGLTIMSNGDVTVCCFDYEGTHNLGNIMNLTLEELFNGEKIRTLRRAHINGERSRIPVCATCDVEKSTINNWWYYR